jgi:hypothetical protein
LGLHHHVDSGSGKSGSISIFAAVKKKNRANPVLFFIQPANFL